MKNEKWKMENKPKGKSASEARALKSAGKHKRSKRASVYVNLCESASEANGRVSMLTCVTQVNIIPIMG